MLYLVSVPIRGLFNLTINDTSYITTATGGRVSVPIRGLFNLTITANLSDVVRSSKGFRPHQGII